MLLNDDLDHEDLFSMYNSRDRAEGGAGGGGL